MSLSEHAAAYVAHRRRWISSDDESRLAEILAEDVGPEHAAAVARVVNDLGFTAEEIVCVNGYGPNGNPELYALASRGWPLVDTRVVFEAWAEIIPALADADRGR